MIKKILLIVLLIVIIGGLIAVVAINLNNNKENNTAKYDVVVSNFASYDFLRAIIKDTSDVNINFILGPGKDSHSYEPTPQDMIEMQDADMFVYIGGELENWSDTVVETLNRDTQNIIKISDSVNLLEDTHDHDHEEEHEHEEEDYDHEEEDHSHEEVHEEFAFDSHIWTSPENAIMMVNKLTEEISKLDSENSDKYRKNADEYIAKINEIDSKIKAVIENSNKSKLVFGDKMPMQYFLEYYNLEVEAAFQGCSTETEPSAQKIAELVNLVEDENMPVVIYTELNDGKIANVIADEAEGTIETLQIQSLHNVTKDNFENDETWVSLMEKNIEVLEKALK